MARKSLRAAKKPAAKGIEAGTIDPHTLVVLDKRALSDSVAKTSRAIIAPEAPMRAGSGAEIAAVLAEEEIEYLDGLIVQVVARNVPLPYSPELENDVLPNEDDVVTAAKRFFQRAT
jgi:pyruvate dehydrogenase E1 component beta subunit